MAWDDQTLQVVFQQCCDTQSCYTLLHLQFHCLSAALTHTHTLILVSLSLWGLDVTCYSAPYPHYQSQPKATNPTHTSPSSCCSALLYPSFQSCITGFQQTKNSHVPFEVFCLYDATAPGMILQLNVSVALNLCWNPEAFAFWFFLLLLSWLFLLLSNRERGGSSLR